MHGDGTAGARRMARPDKTHRFALLLALSLAPALALFAPAAAQASPAPVLSVDEQQTLHWTASGRRHVYKLLSRGGGESAITTITGARSMAPTPVPGATMHYYVKAAFMESAWSNQVAITYPTVEEELLPPPPGEEPPPPPPPRPPPEPPHEEPPEPPHEEPPAEPPSAQRTTIGLDTGGWDWESAVADFSGAVRYVRSSYTNYNSPGQVALLQKYGVHLLPLFNEWSVANLVPWFRAYGKAAGATTAEIVNEPGNPYFWGSGAQGDEARFAQVVEAAHAALEQLPAAERPQLLVSFDGGFEGDNFGRTLIRDDPNLLNLGICWTVHPYGGHGPASALGNRARATEAHEATHQPVCVTEVGWPTAVGQPPTGDSLQWTEAQQAENITNFIEWARSTGYVAMVVSFNYVDYGTNNWYGIERADGSHKRSYTALGEATAEAEREP